MQINILGINDFVIRKYVCTMYIHINQELTKKRVLGVQSPCPSTGLRGEGRGRKCFGHFSKVNFFLSCLKCL